MYSLRDNYGIIFNQYIRHLWFNTHIYMLYARDVLIAGDLHKINVVRVFFLLKHGLTTF